MKFLKCTVFFIISVLPCFQAVMPGGLTEVPVDDPDVIRLSNVALVKLNEVKLGESKRELIEIVKAAKQIVSGSLTHLTLKISEGEATKTCEIKIWEQPWLNKTEVTFSQCDDVVEIGERNKRNVALEKEDDFLFKSFNDFIKKHKKVYEDEKEYKKRFRIFRANLNKIRMLQKSEQGTAQYGVTQFSDMSAKEFKTYLGLKKPQTVSELPMAEIPDISLPDEFDWRHYNAVTPVKNQKACGSCWAFSVTGNIEGQWAIKKGELISLSEQELLDCDSVDHGCEGGYMIDGFKAVLKLGGLESESDYPYEAKDDKCHINRSDLVAKISGAVNLTSSEIDIAKYIVKNGPVSAGINAMPMQFYFGGVSHPMKFMCNPNDLDHGILIVGFGVSHSRFTHKILPYWIIKNSWGKRWGEAGYYRLYRGDGSCGINQMVSSAILN